MGGWVKAVSDGITPLVEVLKQELFQSEVIATDDTSVPVQKKGGTYRGRLWVYIGDVDHPLVVYDYTPTQVARNGSSKSEGHAPDHLAAEP